MKINKYKIINNKIKRIKHYKKLKAHLQFRIIKEINNKKVNKPKIKKNKNKNKSINLTKIKIKLTKIKSKNQIKLMIKIMNKLMINKMK